MSMLWLNLLLEYVWPIAICPKTDTWSYAAIGGGLARIICLIKSGLMLLLEEWGEAVLTDVNIFWLCFML